MRHESEVRKSMKNVRTRNRAREQKHGPKKVRLGEAGATAGRAAWKEFED